MVECAVVGYNHDIKGQAIYAYLICLDKTVDVKVLKNEIDKIVSDKIGVFSRPEQIQIVDGLPKTRSGKIMRRILRKIAEDDYANLGDVSTLLDASVVDQIILGKTKKISQS